MHASATAASLEWESSCRQRAASICTSARLPVNSPMSVRTPPSSLGGHKGCCYLLPPALRHTPSHPQDKWDKRPCSAGPGLT